MSDDTPTQKFDAAGDAPTERLAQAETDAAEAPTGRSRRTIIILTSIGGALLLAVLILLVVLLTRGSGDPVALPTDASTESATPSPTPTESESATPTPTPSATEEPPPPPTEPAGPHFTNFIAEDQVACSAGGPGVDPFVPRIEVAWTSADADEAWYVNGTSDAADSGFMQIPLSGDESDFPYEQLFSCGNDQYKYTITLVGSNGEHVSKTWTVVNTGDNF
jgi:hypothetical protein